MGRGSNLRYSDPEFCFGCRDSDYNEFLLDFTYEIKDSKIVKLYTDDATKLAEKEIITHLDSALNNKKPKSI